MVSVNEFSHVVKLSEMGNRRDFRLAANEVERAGLAARFSLASLEKFEAEIALTAETLGVSATGRLTATLAQYCVATNEPVAAVIDEPIAIRFIPEPTTDAEIELNTEDCDSMFYDRQTIDIGEAVAQSLGLALDPYPRSPNARSALKAAGVKTEDEVAPLGALASLKDLLAKK